MIRLACRSIMKTSSSDITEKNYSVVLTKLMRITFNPRTQDESPFSVVHIIDLVQMDYTSLSENSV